MRQSSLPPWVWTDPVFGRDDYQAFAKDVELSLLDVEEHEEVQIRKTLPAIAERLNILPSEASLATLTSGAYRRRNGSSLFPPPGAAVVESRSPVIEGVAYLRSQTSLTPELARTSVARLLFNRNVPQLHAKGELSRFWQRFLERIHTKSSPDPPTSNLDYAASHEQLRWCGKRGASRRPLRYRMNLNYARLFS